MPELSELFDQIKAGIDLSNDQAKEAAAEALKKSLGPLYSYVTNLGFGAAQAKLQKDVTDAKTAQQAAETKLTEETTRHQQQLTELQNKAPDVKVVNEQWETRLSDAKTRHQNEKEKLAGQLKKVLLQRDQKELEGYLVDRGVPKAVAKRVAKDPELLEARADYSGEGELSVRQAGQQIPIGPNSGSAHLTLLADEVIEQPDIKEILLSDVDRGSGVSGGGQPGTGDKAFFDGLRQSANAKNAEGIPKKPLRERVQGR